MLLPLWRFCCWAAMLAALVRLLPGENTPHWCSLFAALAACVAAVRRITALLWAVAAAGAFALLLLWVGVPPASPLAAARRGCAVAGCGRHGGGLYGGVGSVCVLSTVPT